MRGIAVVLALAAWAVGPMDDWTGAAVRPVQLADTAWTLGQGGGLDPSFASPGVDGVVYSVAVAPDGKVLIGGDLTTVGGASRNGIARLNSDGSLDTSFLDGMSGARPYVYVVMPQPDGKVLIGGWFTSVNGVDLCDGFYCSQLARLNSDGGLDPSFVAAGISQYPRIPAVNAVAVQPDGKVLMGGKFGSVDGVYSVAVARLNPGGSLDTSFQSPLFISHDETVVSMARQPDGKLVIGGLFRTLPNLARLDPDGSVDASFLNGMAGTNASVSCVALQADGKLVIAGAFTSVNGSPRNRIARLNPDGSVDTTFQDGMTGADSFVRSVALQPDGKVLIGGDFAMVNGVTRNRIARLNADGSVDTTFQEGATGADGAVYSVALQSDGRVLIGGAFSSVNGVTSPSVARLYGDLPPEITVEPLDQTSYAGCCAMFRVVATGAALDYRWRKDGVDLTDGGNVSGAASATLTLTDLSEADQGAYSVVVSNALGSDTSNDASLTVVEEVPACQAATCAADLGCVLVGEPGDEDNDSACDDVDLCPNSNVGLLVSIAGCDTGVPNLAFPDGCTLQDRINACGVGAENHGQFAACASDLASDLRDRGVLTGRQAGRIQRCVARSNSRPAPGFFQTR